MSTATSAPSIHLHTRGRVLPEDIDYARLKIAAALDSAQAPVHFVRAKLGVLPDPAVEAPAVVQVNVNLNGRLVRAQAACRTLHEAIDQVQDRLSDRLRRADRDWEAIRGGRADLDAQQWRRHGPAPAGPSYLPSTELDRQVWRHKAFTLGRSTVDEAAFEMDMLGYQFHLFTEKGSGVDSVLLRTADHGYELLQLNPRPDRITEGWLEYTVSTHPAPVLRVEKAMDHLDLTGWPFVFFSDAETGRGCVLYHRYDGHYGLVTPAPTS